MFKNFWKKDRLYIHNPSRPKHYYSQRNNKLRPQSSCFATADVNMLWTANRKFACPDENMQPEDYITSLLLTHEAMEVAAKLGIDAEQDDVRLYYKMHEWVINEKLFGGEQVVEYVKNISLHRVIIKILRNRPVVMGGKFTKLGHMVCVVGLATTQMDIITSIIEPIDASQIKYFIVDDSYGDWHTGYKSKKGNDIHFTYEELDELTSKRAIVMV